MYWFGCGTPFFILLLMLTLLYERKWKFNHCSNDTKLYIYMCVCYAVMVFVRLLYRRLADWFQTFKLISSPFIAANMQMHCWLDYCAPKSTILINNLWSGVQHSKSFWIHPHSSDTIRYGTQIISRFVYACVQQNDQQWTDQSHIYRCMPQMYTCGATKHSSLLCEFICNLLFIESRFCRHR